MNPGPLPLRPVTASSIRSSTIGARPIAHTIPAMLRGDFLGTRRNRIAHEDPGGRHDAADEESAHKGLAHFPNPCDPDCLLSVHRSASAATGHLACWPARRGSATGLRGVT